MRILFATGQGGGHFGPLVPFARASMRLYNARPPGHDASARSAVHECRAPLWPAINPSPKPACREAEAASKQ